MNNDKITGVAILITIAMVLFVVISDDVSAQSLMPNRASGNFSSYLAIFLLGVVIGGVGAISAMHYKEAGAVGKAINHISGAVSKAKDATTD